MGTITSTRGSGWTPKVHDRNRPHPKGVLRKHAQWRGEDDEAGEFFVPPFSKLLSLTTARAFKKALPSNKHPVSLEARCLIPVPPPVWSLA